MKISNRKEEQIWHNYKALQKKQIRWYISLMHRFLLISGFMPEISEAASHM